MKKYKVTLTENEREELLSIVHKGRNRASKIRNATILLNCDTGKYSKKLSDSLIASVLHVSIRSVERIKKLFVEDSFEIALNGKPREVPDIRKIDGEIEAKLIKLACSETTDGYARWTLRLLSEKMVELQYIDSISHETVRQVLKKKNLNLGKKNVL